MIRHIRGHSDIGGVYLKSDLKKKITYFNSIIKDVCLLIRNETIMASFFRALELNELSSGPYPIFSDFMARLFKVQFV